MNHPGAYYVKVQRVDHADYSGELREQICRGAIIELGTGILTDDPAERELWSFLEVGGMIYFKGGFKVGDSVFVSITRDEIIAYETDDD